MLNKRNHETQRSVSVMEAVETLADIGDLDFEKEVSIAKKNEINEQNRQVTELTAKKLHLENEDPDTTIRALREAFHIVLEYVRNFYKPDQNHSTKEESAEGVKTIMVIVGEAVQRLDKYTTLFSHTKEKTVAHLKEYKQLQEFYLSHISRKIDQGVLGKWILELARDAIARQEELQLERRTTTETKHVFIDLDGVRKDTDYELFFLKKEDGTRFFSPRLIRNIKLVCDFEGRMWKDTTVDSFEGLQFWHDEFAFAASKNIIGFLGGTSDRFYRETKQNSRWDIVLYVNKAIMALLLSGNSRNLLRFAPSKTCYEYFNDFLGFLRASMMTREYQKWIAYPPKKTNKVAHSILDMIHAICQGLITTNKSSNEVIDSLNKIIGEPIKSNYIWSQLVDTNTKLQKLIKMHPNGPLVKVLEIIKQGGYYTFDPFAQYNIPDQLFSLYHQENKITNLRIPSPTIQEYIHKAGIVEEFKGFLRGYQYDVRKKKHLLVNLQDRTSWKEHFRSIALEELQNNDEFSKTLTVVTLAKDTEFYEQLPPYDLDSHADVFISHFQEQLHDENCGFYFPDSIKKEIFPKFVNGVIAAIHRVFFNGKNVLSVSNRRDFIEIFYLFLELKLIDIVQPDSFSLTCKDGVDVGQAASVLLYLFIGALNGGDDIKKANGMIYLPALLVRERVMQQERFNRMIDALKLIEYIKEEYGAKQFDSIINDAFGIFYNTPILKVGV